MAWHICTGPDCRECWREVREIAQEAARLKDAPLSDKSKQAALAEGQP